MASTVVNCKVNSIDLGKITRNGQACEKLRYVQKESYSAKGFSLNGNTRKYDLNTGYIRRKFVVELMR